MVVILTPLDSVEDRCQLTRFPAIVGRGRTADVQVAADKWVSRSHCQIDLVNGELWVRDLESRNGTLVNGKRIIRAELTPGDQLTVGASTFEFSFEPVLSEEPMAQSG